MTTLRVEHIDSNGHPHPSDSVYLAGHVPPPHRHLFTFHRHPGWHGHHRRPGRWHAHVWWWHSHR